MKLHPDGLADDSEMLKAAGMDAEAYRLNFESIQHLSTQDEELLRRHHPAYELLKDIMDTPQTNSSSDDERNLATLTQMATREESATAGTGATVEGRQEPIAEENIDDIVTFTEEHVEPPVQVVEENVKELGDVIVHAVPVSSSLSVSVRESAMEEDARVVIMPHAIESEAVSVMVKEADDKATATEEVVRVETDENVRNLQNVSEKACVNSDTEKKLVSQLDRSAVDGDLSQEKLHESLGKGTEESVTVHGSATGQRKCSQSKKGRKKMYTGASQGVLAAVGGDSDDEGKVSLDQETSKCVTGGASACAELGNLAEARENVEADLQLDRSFESNLSQASTVILSQSPVSLSRQTSGMKRRLRPRTREGTASTGGKKLAKEEGV